jgi:hypothetical protein
VAARAGRHVYIDQLGAQPEGELGSVQLVGTVHVIDVVPWLSLARVRCVEGPSVQFQWWYVVLVVGIPVLGKVIIVVWSLRETKPRDRPQILRAVAHLFPIASWSLRRRRAEPERPPGDT